MKDVMLAEEYIETRRCKDSISNKFDMCYMDSAYKAVEMARQEEREKAAKIFIKLIKAFNMSGKEGYDSLEKDFLELLSQ